MNIKSELKFEELSTEQKLGMVMAGIIRPIRCEDKYETYEQNLEFVISMIRSHSLGAVWIPATTIQSHPEAMRRVHEAADYPLLIFTDAESGLGEFTIGRHNNIAVADSERLAYIFGKLTAIQARKLGYNVVCDPVLDSCSGWAPVGGNIRSMGSNKERIASLAEAEARGLRDGGVLTVAKHYPSARAEIDSHMGPAESYVKREALIENNLYPYRELMKKGLLDGAMASHVTIKDVDDLPTSVSEKTIGIARELGFDGFMITDALDMMGLKALFGDSGAKGMCIKGGCDIILPWFSARKAYNDLTECFEQGVFSEERLNEAVKRVLAAQHKVALMQEPSYTEITEEEASEFYGLHENSVYTRTDEGVPTAISKDGKHFFVMLVKNETELGPGGTVSVDTFTQGWYYPARIAERLQRTFPNSKVYATYQFPTPNQNMDVLQESLDYEDVNFITFAECPAYAGSDHLTHRIVALISAMQRTERISTLMHFGNPYVLEELPHVKRLLIGCISDESVKRAIEVLAGEGESHGRLTYDVKLK